MSIVLTFLLINNKAFAQTEPIRQPPFVEYPIFILKARFWGYETPIRENAYTYEFDVDYYIEGVLISAVGNNDYFFINDIGIGFRKGLDRRTNSFKMVEVFANTGTNTTWFTLRITIVKSKLYNNYPDPLDYYLFFLYDTALYIYFPDADTVDSYNRGYSEGYNSGFESGRSAGYNQGYNDGRNTGYTDGYNTGYYAGYTDGVRVVEPEAYQRGYNDGYSDGIKEPFYSNFHVWIVPAIIVVVIAGIFVGYRRERFGGE